MGGQGFYKINDNGRLICASKKVQNKNFELTLENKDQHQYPVDGWYYFETREEAEAFFISQGWEKPEEPEEVQP